MFHNTTPREKLEIILQLAELCIELIQQNEEHHAEVSINFLFLSNFLEASFTVYRVSLKTDMV